MSDFKHLLVEKYRPQTLNDLCLSQDIKDLILSWGTEIPHLLFCGQAGGGKTSLARIIVQDILKCDYLYINASDENGVDTIRTKVTGFVQTKSFNGNIKVVILDEADGLSLEGQKCLRNLMESYADITRFILTGNYKHKINVALQSRCQSLDIRPSQKDALIRCLYILKEEGIDTTLDDKKAVQALVKQYFPDLRKCINEIQKCVIGDKFFIQNKLDNNPTLELIWENLKNKKSLETRKFLIQNDGLFNSDWDQLLVDLLNYIYNINIKDSEKKSMIMTIADHLDKASRVIDKEINFFACMLNLENV